MGNLCESVGAKRKRETLLTLYQSQPRSTLYLRGRFSLQERVSRKSIDKDFRQLRPSFICPVAGGGSGVQDFAFD